jgi:hypothetical protein
LFRTLNACEGVCAICGVVGCAEPVPDLSCVMAPDNTRSRLTPGEMTGGYEGLIIALAAAFAALYAAIYVGFPLLIELFVAV